MFHSICKNYIKYKMDTCFCWTRRIYATFGFRPPKRWSFLIPKENSYSYFLKDQISVEPDLDFEIELLTFLSPLVNNIDSKIVKEYRKGLITDAKFLENSIAFQKFTCYFQRYYQIILKIFPKLRYMLTESNANSKTINIL